LHTAWGRHGKIWMWIGYAHSRLPSDEVC
jgi:hypothetical protein